MTSDATLQQFYREFECVAASGSRYRLSFVKLNKPLDSYNRWRELKIELSNDKDRTWHSLPLKLGFTSKVRLWLSAQPEWPPEIVVGFGVEGDAPWFEYDDDTSELGWLGWASRWRARFNSQKGQWNLERLQLLKSAKT